MDSATKSHRRALWLIVAILFALIVGLFGYELNWIRQRRALLAGESVGRETVYPFFHPGFPGELQCCLGPHGRTTGLRFLTLLGEERAPYLSVFLGNCDPDSPIDASEKHFCDKSHVHLNGRAIEDVELIQQVHSLFPEAAIVARFTRKPPRELPRIVR